MRIFSADLRNVLLLLFKTREEVILIPPSFEQYWSAYGKLERERGEAPPARPRRSARNIKRRIKSSFCLLFVAEANASGMAAKHGTRRKCERVKRNLNLLVLRRIDVDIRETRCR